MNKIHKKILDLIFNSVTSEGGDGDAAWLCKHILMKDIIKLVEEYNLENKTGWEIIEKKDYILWGENQQWATITNNKEIFESQPDWTILKINY